MRLIIPLITLFFSLLVQPLANAGCTNLNARLNLSNPDSTYTDNGDWTITDNKTGLMWKKCPLGLDLDDCSRGAALSLNWSDAMRAAGSVNDDNGYTDWRIPNKNELNSLVEYACSLPAINSTFFPNGPTIENAYGNYWTSTPLVDDGNKVWYINFQSGGPSLTNVSKDSRLFVRLVRGGVLTDEIPRVVQPPNFGKTRN